MPNAIAPFTKSRRFMEVSRREKFTNYAFSTAKCDCKSLAKM
jgi:hypothetical protein